MLDWLFLWSQRPRETPSVSEQSPNQVALTFQGLGAKGPNITKVTVRTGLLWQLIGGEFQRPPVKLAIGPIDKILGAMNILNGHIEIDVGELSLQKRCVEGGPRVLKDAITRAIAHEARHRWQLAKVGKRLMIAEKIALGLVGLLLAIVSMGVLPVTIVRWAHQHLGPGGYYLVHFFVVLFNAFFFLLFFRTAPHILYRFSPSELDARQFADAVAEDPRWSPVVEVQQQHAMPPELLGLLSTLLAAQAGSGPSSTDVGPQS